VPAGRRAGGGGAREAKRDPAGRDEEPGRAPHRIIHAACARAGARRCGVPPPELCGGALQVVCCALARSRSVDGVDRERTKRPRASICHATVPTACDSVLSMHATGNALQNNVIHATGRRQVESGGAPSEIGCSCYCDCKLATARDLSHPFSQLTDQISDATVPHSAFLRSATQPLQNANAASA
jgi:hypothetical protein